MDGGCKKFIYSILFASVLVIGNVGQAVAHDSVTTLDQIAASKSFAQLAIPLSVLLFENNIRASAEGLLGVDTFVGTKNVDSSLDIGLSKPITNQIDSRALQVDEVIFVHSAEGRNMPVSSIPEPKSFPMLLSGFALLCFSARRRKNDAFD